jgi:hypothetical protein
MTTENTAAKGVADRMLRSRQIAVDRHRDRTRTRIGISSEIGFYLTLNWQCVEIGLRHPSADRRFPTPHRRLLTCFGLTNEERHIVATDLAAKFRFSGRRYCSKAERGAGGSAQCSRQDVLIHKLTRNFITKGLPCSVLPLEKNAGTRNGHAPGSGS